MFKFLKNVEQRALNKLTWTQNKLYIEGYGQILNITRELVQVTNFTIKGSNLSVVSFDGHMMEVTGIINSIEKGE